MTNNSQDKFRTAAKKALIDKGKSICQLAAEMRLHRNTVSQAINHPILPTVRRRIARKLNLDLV